jgi:(p)ppGpp synthase/HD superfamily hydrolase
MNIIDNARQIASQAHEGQRRKWGTQAPYIVHPTRVAAKVQSLSGTTDVDVAAAFLHDVVEDIAIPLNKVDYYNELIRTQCGSDVLQLVLELTNPTHGPEWDHRPRVEKRAKDWEHLSQISDRAKRIKLVDRWDNIGDFQGAPRRLVAKYIPESRHLLGMIRYVDEVMAAELEERINQLEKNNA